MADAPTAYLSPKLVVRERAAEGGPGIFAVEPVRAGELLTVWSGYIVNAAQLAGLSPLQQKRSIQVEEGLYLVSMRLDEPADYVNHSCNPNAGLSGQIALMAMRDIQAGEEVCFDYAMSDGTPYDEFACACGAPDCRGRVSGDDWRNPELWARYAGYFSPYLQRRITALQEQAISNYVTAYNQRAHLTPTMRLAGRWRGNAR